MPARSRTSSLPASSTKPAVAHVHFADRAALRAWLEANHSTSGAIWLVYDKKVEGKARALSYDDIVEEALCFGWIDSVSGSVDARRAKLYFSPRKPRSVWSALNKKRIVSLLQRGLMTPAGQSKIDAAQADGSWTALDQAEAGVIPDDLAKALRRNGAARRHLEGFPPGARKQVLLYLTSAKRPETRERRLAEIIAKLELNQRMDGTVGKARPRPERR